MKKTSQSGAALIVALVMLLISTMVGIASIRGTVLNEKMSSNMYDRSLAYQAAEAALRAGEAALEADQSIGIDCTVSTVNCPSIPSNTFTVNSATGWASVSNAFRVNTGKMATAPQYYVEKLGEVGGTDEFGISESANCANYAGCDQTAPTAALFRITGRSNLPANDGRSVVALQITVKQNL